MTETTTPSPDKPRRGPKPKPFTRFEVDSTDPSVARATIVSPTYGLCTLTIDSEAAPSASCHRWHVYKQRSGKLYAQARTPHSNIYLHRLILPSAEFIVHANGNGLDCRKENLLSMTSTEGRQKSQSIHSQNSTGFKGVSFCKLNPNRPWLVYICVAGDDIYIGSFVTPESAARAYDDAVRQYRPGPGARFNFPRPGERSVFHEKVEHDLNAIARAVWNLREAA